MAYPNTVSGAWHHDPSKPWGDSDSWTYVADGSPDPVVVQEFGADAAGDFRQNPIGEPNLGNGTWREFHFGTDAPGPPKFYWDPGGEPDEWVVENYGHDNATNPAKTPDLENAPPPNVTPPDLTDEWLLNDDPGVDGLMDRIPDITGGPPPGESGETLSEPPTVNDFAVLWAGIRNAELVIYHLGLTVAEGYRSLQGTVKESAGWDIFVETSAIDVNNSGDLMSTQNNLLLQAADMIKQVGDFLEMLNAAAQNYARADIDSFPPTEGSPAVPVGA